jgi:Mg-chelatase subunit ChlI
VFTNILIADEVNRATPRTQSSLLEVMEERQVSMDGATYPLPPVFFVLATQNPIEQHGTYPLPEAQLDRFLMKLSMGYPDGVSERTMLEAHLRGNPVNAIRPVVRKPQFLALQRFIRERITVSRELQEYILAITTSLRGHKDLTVGPSPRASIALMRASMASACVAGRDFVIPDDVKTLASSVLAHRLVLHAKAFIKHVRPEDVVDATVKQLSVPTGRSSVIRSRRHSRRSLGRGPQAMSCRSCEGSSSPTRGSQRPSACWTTRRRDPAGGHRGVRRGDPGHHGPPSIARAMARTLSGGARRRQARRAADLVGARPSPLRLAPGL